MSRSEIRPHLMRADLLLSYLGQGVRVAHILKTTQGRKQNDCGARVSSTHLSAGPIQKGVHSLTSQAGDGRSLQQVFKITLLMSTER